MVRVLSLCIALLGAFGAAGSRGHVEVSADFEPPAGRGADAAVVVHLRPTDPGVHVNEEPPPRLALDPAQKVLVDKQAPATSKPAAFDPELTRYLDPRAALRFPVAIARRAPKGRQLVQASITYFYCSKTEGWCRKGKDDIEVAVDVR